MIHQSFIPSTTLSCVYVLSIYPLYTYAYVRTENEREGAAKRQHTINHMRNNTRKWICEIEEGNKWSDESLSESA